MNKSVRYLDLGLIDYEKCFEYQKSLFEKIIATKKKNRSRLKQKETDNYLIFCEHPHVYTLGKNGDEKNLLVNKTDLIKTEADFYKTNRGGDITYHGPGQIVGYPVLDLNNFFTDLDKYLRLLEEGVILTLKEFGLDGMRSKGETGVWLDVGTLNARKICAFGVKTSFWVSMHGLAFNVNSDLSYFKNIIPCGIVGKGVTSLEKELGAPVNIQIVKEKLRSHIARLFEMKII